MATLPTSLALSGWPVDGSAMVAAPGRTDLAAIQTCVNGVVTYLTPSASGQVLQSTSTSAATWVNGVKTTTSTLAGGPPGAPADTDIWIATAVDANGTRWSFQYNSGSASAFKWECIGGPAVYVEVATSESTTSGVDVDLATVGPSFTLARAGDYGVRFGFQVVGGGTGNGNAISNLNVNNVAAVGLSTNVGTVASATLTPARETMLAGRSAADVLKLRYQITNAQTTTFSNRWIAVTPRRIA